MKAITGTELRPAAAAAAAMALAIGLGFSGAAVGASGQDKSDARHHETVQQHLDVRNGTSLTLAGKVSEVGDSHFTLDYGKGNVVVEMDDWDWYSEDPGLAVGDKVTVHGALDDDAFERKTIEANAVYVDKLSTFFYASAADEESGYFSYPLTAYAGDGSWVTVAGNVSDIDGGEMIIDTGIRNIHVDTDEMSYDPFSDDLRQVREGMRVSVYGQVDNADLFEAREIDALSIITLAQDPTG